MNLRKSQESGFGSHQWEFFGVTQRPQQVGQGPGSTPQPPRKAACQCYLAGCLQSCVLTAQRQVS